MATKAVISLYEVYPYLYVVTGLLVDIIWRYSPFARIIAVELVIGVGYIIYLRYMHRRDMRLRSSRPDSMSNPHDSQPVV